MSGTSPVLGLYGIPTLMTRRLTTLMVPLSLKHMSTDDLMRWAVIGICAIAVATWLRVIHVGLEMGSVMPKLQFAGIMVCFGVLFGVVGSKLPKIRFPLAVVSDLCFSVLQALAVTTILLPLTFLSATIGFPLLDERLAQIDAMIGFDWDTAAKWVADRPFLDWLLQLGYNSMPYQVAAVLVIGSVKRPGDRNGECIWLLIVSLLITCAIFAFTPALGKVGHVGTGYLDILAEIRNGTWSVLSYSRAEGIVTFPSFHTTSAILLTDVARRERFMFAVLAPLNVLMIASTPTVGGHYAVDLVGGAVVAIISMIIVRSVRERTTRGAIRGLAGAGLRARLALIKAEPSSALGAVGLSPAVHPAMSRVPATFEPMGLGEATGRGAEPIV